MTRRGNSFNAGFFGALGVIAALVAVGGIWYAVTQIGQHAQRSADSEMAAIAKKYALAALKKHEITALGKEADAANVNGQWVVSGPALDRYQKIRDVYVSFRVATTGKGQKWQVDDVQIDGDPLLIDGASP
jgi:hypothetical protein